MDWQHSWRRHLICVYCQKRFRSNHALLLHVGEAHPDRCEEVEMGRLGKIIFHQKSAGLFHCHACFYTARAHARLVEHIILTHCVSAASKDEKSGQADKTAEPTRPPNGEREGDEDEAATDNEEDEDYSPAQRTPKEREDDAKEGKTELSEYIRRAGGRYYCNLCDWSVKAYGFILNHIKRKHDIPKPYTCDVCNKTFLLRSAFKKHSRFYHCQGAYQCPYCVFRSDYVRGIRRHMCHCCWPPGGGESSGSEGPPEAQ